MKWLSYRNKPLIVNLLQIVCLALTIFWIFVAILGWARPKYIMGTHVNLSQITLIYALVWIIITAGVWKLRKWGWALLFGTNLFTSLVTVNLMLARPIENKMLLGGAALGGLVFVWILNLSIVRTPFKVDFLNSKKMPSQLLTFAISCLTVGIVLLFELLTGSRLAPATAPSRMFVGSLGLAFIIMGIGIWQTNKIALQAPKPVLLFALLSVGFIYAKDFLDATRYFPVPGSLFHIAIIVGLLIYWLAYLRPQIAGTINHLMPRNG